ncbi:DUF421 domain-containing protein [Metabacillus arenae]|uniref:DUF421 domain-containing protein n=1 Tax=Metabacillus arenae TaxID=2771434 RepID=A0A926NJ02_9BACI|nr:DUF421 domain-containing protein [Metabacillus arenae]MBD1381955.1 DUF421 domain-containing protein [Metabacillus arenae]
MEFAKISVELIIGFFGLFVITTILGKTQITQITPFDFISALVLGELVGNAVFDENIGLVKILFATALWGILIYMIEVITQKFKGTRKFFEGSPAIIIHKGQILKQVLKKAKLDINQLQHLIRSKGVFSLREIEYAILETDGTVSVLKKAPFDTPTLSDLNLSANNVNLPITLIIDGEIVWDNLKEARLSKDWLIGQLKQQKIERVKDVFYAEWQEGAGLFVQQL